MLEQKIIYFGNDREAHETVRAQDPKLSLTTNLKQELTSFRFGQSPIHIPHGEFKPFEQVTGHGSILVEDFTSHPMNLGNRFGEQTDLSRISEDPTVLITYSTEDNKVGWSIPRDL